MRFRVLEGREPREVQLSFGSESELSFLRQWRLPKELLGSEPARDAREYARLATKRWRYHNRTGRITTDSSLLREAARRKSREEVAFLLLARATWQDELPVLGFAQCHRTWCGHIFLDFLSVHPRIAGKQGPRIRGLGTGILFAVCALAVETQAAVVWGETTESSVAFYRHTLGRKSLLDCLRISGRKLQWCSEEFKEIQIEKLESKA
jgi:hypothetical protein